MCIRDSTTIDDSVSSSATSRHSSRAPIVGLVAALIGVALLVATVRQVGWTEIRQGVGAVGGWFALVVLLGGARFFARAQSWVLCANRIGAPGLAPVAAFGAVLVIALGLADVRSWALPVAALAMALASVFVLLAIAGRNAGLLILILSGLGGSRLGGAAGWATGRAGRTMCCTPAARAWARTVSTSGANSGASRWQWVSIQVGCMEG